MTMALRRVGLALAVVASVTLVAITSAAADECPVVSGSSAKVGNTTTVTASCEGQTAPDAPNIRRLTPAERWAIHCEGIGSLGAYQTGDAVRSYPTQDLTVDDVIAEGLDPTGTYVYWSHQCIPADGLGGFTGQVVYQNTPPVPITVLRDRARARITIDDPDLASNPPLDDPDRFSVVRIPTWLWIGDPTDPADTAWDPVGPEAETSGFVTVSVTAVPQYMEWNMGDGSASFRCGDPLTPPGIAWAPGLADSATNCSHTYTKSSAGVGAGNVFTLTGTVRWQFEWSINGVPQPPFEDYDAVAPPIAHQVGEIQAVGTPSTP